MGTIDRERTQLQLVSYKNFQGILVTTGFVSALGRWKCHKRGAITCQYVRMRHLDSTQRVALATALERARTDRSWTQSDLAKAAGMSLGAISNIETGQTKSIRPQTEANLRRAFGWTPEQFEQAVAGNPTFGLPAGYEQAGHALIAATEIRVGRDLTDDERALLLRAVDAMFEIRQDLS